eukprot:IDg21542t1
MAFISKSPIIVLKRARNERSVCTFRASASKNGDRFSRREFAFLLQSAAASAAFLRTQNSAEAMSGLKIFPLSEPLTNIYYLMRAAECVADAQGVARSNPIEMTSIDVHGLTRGGIQQAINAAEALRSEDVEYDAWIWSAIATNSMETAEVLAYELNIRRERVVPEFSFLDARGLGALDGRPQSEVKRILKDMDSKDVTLKPMPNDDGTPNDSASDVFVRVRQLLSKLETQYFGERIVIVAPDSEPLSVLQSALTGVDLSDHHALYYAPGELRKVRERVVHPIDGLKLTAQVD